MRQSRRLIFAFALAALVLGTYRWVRPPARSAATVETPAASASQASTPSRLLSVGAQVTAKKLQFEELGRGIRPSPGDTNFPWRARNTAKSVDQLARDPHALLLRNALIDTASGKPLPLPAGLVAGSEPGFHVVQSVREPDVAFRRKIESAGLKIISYIPNNAFLVQGSDESVERLALDPDVEAIPPWHPAFKLEPALLARVIDDRALDFGDRLMISITDPSAMDRLAAKGVREVTRQRSPFGTLVTVDVAPDSLVALAQSPDIHLIEEAHGRELLNDRSGYLLGSSTDLTNTVSYQNLTGSNIVININDSGIDWGHPDLTTNRVSTVGSQTNLLTDIDGHGTHVAGTIAGSGVASDDILGPFPIQGSVTNANFRGHAPNAKLFILPIDLQTGPTISDAFLQEQAALTNALISNNSWGYIGAYDYNSISASYDAASRDALPEVSGEQPVLFVFAAGNSGGGGNNGVGGFRGTVSVPANAKNVVTVGALESKRELTNAVVLDDQGRVIFAGGRQFRAPETNAELRTNLVLMPPTDTDTEVANFSSRGNVGVGIEGSYGRFKPDVVAPGSYILSDRSAQWELANEYDTNSVQYAVFDELNKPVGPWYRFLSGTSMAAPAVSGFLAQVQEYWQRPGRSIPRVYEAAAFKSFLINSARPTADTYGADFRSVINYAGWGRPSLPKALDSGVRSTDSGGNLIELAGFAGELFTGASQFLRLRMATNDVATNSAFHFTLVWTDPPGNPAAGIKLVNDLDLVVSNVLTGEVFVGNDFQRGVNVPRVGTNLFEVVEEGVTNSVFDTVNNVERVVIPPPLAPEYVIQVVARRVNVNALASRPYVAPENAPADYQHPAYATNIVQDFVVALASDAAMVSNSIVATAEFLSSTTPGLGVITPPPITVLATNGIPASAMRVGANSPLFGGFPGQSNQWHFFVFTNLFDTNAALATGLTNGRYVEFVISSAANISRPRGPGVTTTRLRDRQLGPDLDLYMSRDRGLTNLNPVALANAFRSTQQGGEERIEITNAPANGEVYYVGVKAEDQQAGEFELIIRSSNQPFSILGSNGYELLMTPVGGSRTIPDGTPDAPGVIRYFGTGPSGWVRNVTLIQSLVHENFFDLQGSLIHGGYGVIINNRRAIRDLNTGINLASGPVVGLYDDVPGFRFPFGQPTDGPSTTLLDFSGMSIGGSWNYLLQDDVLGGVGLLNRVQVQVQPQVLPAFDERVFERICIPARSYDFRFRYVPPDASRLIVEVTNMAPTGLPLEIYIRREAFPDPTNPDINDRVATITSPGGIVSISSRDVPPLQSGYYFVLFHNPGGVELCFDVAIYGERNLSSRFTATLTGSSTNLSDVARTVAAIQVADGRPVADVDVAVRAQHPRISDMALRLVAPGGAGAYLFENRGLTTTNGLGGVLLSSNYQHVALSLDRVAQRAVLYFNGEPVAAGLVPRSQTNFATSFHFGYDPAAAVGSVPVRLDDFGVWRRAVREDEMRRIFEEGSFGRGKLQNQSVRGLVSLWPFDSSGIDTVSGQNAVLSGAVVPAAGQIDQGRLFPGGGGGGVVTNDILRGVSTLSGFTLEGWIKPLSGNESVVVAGWFNADEGILGPALLVGQPAPYGNGPGSISAIFNDPSGNFIVISSPAGVLPASGIVTNRAYAVFSDNTNGVYTPIKFAEPPYLSRSFPATIVSNNWDTVAAADYSADTNNLVEGWQVLTNIVSVVSTGTIEGQALDVRNGAVLRRFDLNVGQRYSFAFTSRTSPAATNTVSAEVYVDDVLTRLVQGTPDWVTNRVNFAGESSRTGVELRALAPALSDTNFPPGLEIGRVWLDQSGTALTYQPEEPIRPLLGRPGTGEWQLQMTDARGDQVGELLDWQLRFIFMPTNTPAVRLTNGFSYTTNLVGDDPRYFIIDVPLEAERATNILENISGGPLFLLYSDTGLPDLTEDGDVFLAGPVNSGELSVSVLNTNLPPLLPRGQRYYLAVRSFDTGASNVFTIRTDFGLKITPLTNGVALRVTNANPSLTDYYSFEVSTNGALGVTFALTALTGDMDLYVTRAPKLPGPSRFDYFSSNAGISNETILIHGGSQPVPLSPGLWYVGVANASGVRDVAYTITATEQTGGVRQLTPGIPISALNNGVDDDHYYVDVPEEGLALRVSLRFLDDDLVLSSRIGLPLPTDFSNDYLSDNPGAADEDIIITTTSAPVPLRGGRWYFTVTGLTGNPAAYVISAELRTQSAEILSIQDGVGILSGTSGGPTVQEFYFPNPGAVTALGFEIYELTDEADLLVSPDAPLPVAVRTFTNTRPGTDSELVVLRAGVDFPTLARDWYLRVTLPSTNAMSYRVRVNVERDGILTIGEPLVIRPVIGTNGVVSELQWRAIPGERYRVDSTTSLLDPIVWTPVSTVTATSDFLAVPLPDTPANATLYYRVVQIPKTP